MLYLLIQIVELLSTIAVALKGMHEIMKRQEELTQNDLSKLLTSADVKIMLDIKASTLYELKRNKILVPRRIGTVERYYENDVRRLLESRVMLEMRKRPNRRTASMNSA